MHTKLGDPTPWRYWRYAPDKVHPGFSMMSPYPGGQRSLRAKTLKRHNYPLVWICIPNWVTLPLGDTEMCSGQVRPGFSMRSPYPGGQRSLRAKTPEKAQLPPNVNMHAKSGDLNPWGYWVMLRTKSGQDFQWWAPILDGKGHRGPKPWKGITIP